MQVEIPHLQMFNPALLGTRHTTSLQIDEEAHDFAFQLSLNPQRLNSNQFLAELENIFTLPAATLPLYAHGREMAGAFHKHGTGCRIGWQ